MNKTKFLLIVICVIAISYSSKPALGDPADPLTVDAECDITITVESIVEWEGAAFAQMDLTAITNQSDAPEDSSIYTLWTNSNVTLSSDQTAASQLTDGTDTLVTKYKIATDEAGVTATGATAAAVLSSSSDVWTVHSDFLETALAVTHVSTDGAVEVTLSVQATNDTDNVADTGAYTATQTITATWISDN